MQIDKNIRSGNKETDKYIETLEKYIISWDASNIKKLIVACDDIAGIIADDVRILGENLDDDAIEAKLQMLGSKKNKRYEQFLTLVGQIKHFKAISDITEDLKPKVVELTVEEKQIATEASKEKVQPVRRI